MKNFHFIFSQISIDKCVLIILISAIIFYFLPQAYFFSFKTVIFSAVLFSFLLWLCYRIGFLKYFSFIFYSMLFIFCLFYMQQRAIPLISQAENLANLSNKIEANFKIKEILYRGQYETMIVEANLQENQPPYRLYLNWQLADKTKIPQIGEKWYGELTLRPISSRLNIGGFDRQKWYFSQGITGWARVKSAVLISQDFSSREKIFTQVFQQTKHLSQQGLLLALSFGIRAYLPSDIWAIYQQTNTAHLIAISGLHIGLAMGVGFWLCRLLQFFLPTPQITPIMPIIIGLLFACAYSYLAGFAIPTLRALLALFLFCSFRLSSGYCSSWQLFGRVVVLLLLLDPLMVLSNSFWLSVGAVFCLILWYSSFPLNLLQWRNQALPWYFKFPLGLVHLQLGLLILFLPIQWGVFGGFSAYGFIANLIIVPIFSLLIVPIILFSLLTKNFFNSWQWANNLLEITNNILEYFQGQWWIISEGQKLIATSILILIWLAMLFWGYGRKIKEPESLPLWKKDLIHTRKLTLNPKRHLELKPYVMFGGVIILFSLLNYGYRQWQQPNWRFETLDVGQGLANLIIKNNKAVLYDTGASWNGGSFAELEILPYLQRQGLTVEMLILSHDDNDHVGGATKILKQFPQVKLITPSLKNYIEEQNSQNQHRTFCIARKQWQWQDIQFSALSPNNIAERANNSDSCVILVDDGKHRILLTGDLDRQTELKLLAQLPEIDILQVAHHGSRSSTTAEFLAKMQPKIALISTGRWNQWKMPHQEVIERLKQQKTLIFNTALSGQISVNFYPYHYEIYTARHKFSPWYAQIFGEITNNR